MISELKNLLENLASVGIESTIIEPEENGIRIRASDSSRSIIVFDSVEMGPFTDRPIGVQSVRALLTRLNLFPNDAKVEFETDDESVVNISIKKGRKKASYRCASPQMLAVPTQALDDLDIREDNAITLTKEYVGQINNVIQSISMTGSKENQTVSILVKDSNASLIIYDGEDDSFNDTIENVSMESCERATWDIKSFHKVMRESITGNDETTFGISSFGTATFNVGLVSVIVCPFV